MSHNSQAQWSKGNDGFGYHDERERFVETPNPIIQAEAQFLVDIVTNLNLPRWKRKNAYLKLIKQYGHYIEPDDAEWYYSHDTESEASDSDGSCSDASDSDASGSGSDGSGSEQCPVASQNSQSMGQQLLPNNSDAKVADE